MHEINAFLLYNASKNTLFASSLLTSSPPRYILELLWGFSQGRRWNRLPCLLVGSPAVRTVFLPRKGSSRGRSPPRIGSNAALSLALQGVRGAKRAFTCRFAARKYRHYCRRWNRLPCLLVDSPRRAYRLSSSQGELEGAKPASNQIKCRAKPCAARRAWSEANIFVPLRGT